LDCGGQAPDPSLPSADNGRCKAATEQYRLPVTDAALPRIARQQNPASQTAEISGVPRQEFIIFRARHNK
jgi:hypothetical protein